MAEVKRILLVGGITLVLAWPAAVSFSRAEDPALSDMNLEWLKKREESRQWGRDPFVLPEVSRSDSDDKQEGGFRLSAIIFRQGKGVAIINNQIVRMGDEIGGFRVVGIYPDRVLLKDASGTQELRVNRFMMGQ